VLIPCLIGLGLPLLGTCLGAASVFFLHSDGHKMTNILNGFASGVMLAASIWSLLIPAMNQVEHWGRLQFLPAVSGLLLGFLFLFAADHMNPAMRGEKNAMLSFAVNLHNLPEGMAVGAVYAGLLSGVPDLHLSGALALSAGIAIQNIPEGAILSLPQYAAGAGRGKAFCKGLISGIIEPIGAAATIVCHRILEPALPYLLGFAAGAMICVVLRDLVPEFESKQNPCRSLLCFALGFSLMMILDVSLG